MSDIVRCRNCGALLERDDAFIPGDHAFCNTACEFAFQECGDPNS